MLFAADVPLLTDLKEAIAEMDARQARQMQDVTSLDKAFATPESRQS